MKFSAKEIAITAVAAILLFVTASFIYAPLFSYLMPTVTGTIFNVDNFESAFQQSLTFAILWAAVPVISLLLWKIVPVNAGNQRMIAVLMITAGMIIALLGRKYYITSQLKNASKDISGFQLNTQLITTIQHINYEYWMMAGLLAGVTFTFLFFRKKRK